jgi:hypothetical protein
MKIKIEISELEMKQLVVLELYRRLGNVEIDEKLLRIEVKSKQNYKSEWEIAAFRATYEGTV